jgi:DNA invertase Pin-like site-specific DNA recombinase
MVRRNISHVLLDATQKKLGEWAEKVKGAVELKQEELLTYEGKKQQLISELKEAHEKGVPIRELARITGISNATLGRWIKELKEKEKLKHVEQTTPETA